MSKSKGEFLTVSLLESKGYDPLAYRFMCLQSHYRKQLLFSYESLDNAVVAYNKLKNKIKSLKNNLEGNIEEAKEKYETLFKRALENDLNTSDALTILYDVLKSNLNNKTKLFLVEEFDKVLSLDLLKEDKIDEELKKYILEKIEERNVAKKNKDYSKADNIREELESRGILISDTREGTSYQLK